MTPAEPGQQGGQWGRVGCSTIAPPPTPGTCFCCVNFVEVIPTPRASAFRGVLGLGPGGL